MKVSQKFRIWKHLLLSLVLFGAAVPLLFNGLLAHSVAQSKQEREVEDTIPKQVPIKVKLKSEKERAFKDLTNAEWQRDFELEVTNTSAKPIYFLELWLMLPDVKSENNNPIAFSLRYGRADFIHFSTRPVSTDVPIQPGETHAFTIPEEWQRGWREFKARSNAPNPSKVRIKFVQLNFEDGTGFSGGGEAFPYSANNRASKALRQKSTSGLN